MIEEIGRGVAGSTPGVEMSSAWQTRRGQILSSFHIVPNYKYPVAQQQPGSRTQSRSLRCPPKVVWEQMVQFTSWMELGVAVW